MSEHSPSLADDLASLDVAAARGGGRLTSDRLSSGGLSASLLGGAGSAQQTEEAAYSGGVGGSLASLPTLYGDTSRPISLASISEGLTLSRPPAASSYGSAQSGVADAPVFRPPVETRAVATTPTTPPPSTPTDPAVVTPPVIPPVTPTTPTEPTTVPTTPTEPPVVPPVTPPVVPPVTPPVTPPDPPVTPPDPPAPPTNNNPTGTGAASAVTAGATAQVIGQITLSDADGDAVTPTLPAGWGARAELVQVDATHYNVRLKAGQSLTLAEHGADLAIGLADGRGGSGTAHIALSVSAPANQATLSGVPASTTVTLDTSDIHVLFPGALVSHPDATATLTATVRILTSGGTPDGTLAALIVPGGVTVTGRGSGVYDISGTAADLQAAIRGLGLDPANGTAAGTTRINVEVGVTDGGTGSSSAMVGIDAVAAPGTAGADDVTLGSATTHGAVDLGAGTDILRLAAGATTLDGDTDLSTTAGLLAGVEQVYGTAGDNTFTVGGTLHGATGTWVARSSWAAYQATVLGRIDLGGGTDTLVLQGDAAVVVDNTEQVNHTTAGYVRVYPGTSYEGGTLRFSGTGGDSIDPTFVQYLTIDADGWSAVGVSGPTGDTLYRNLTFVQAMTSSASIGLNSTGVGADIAVAGGTEHWGTIQGFATLTASGANDDLTVDRLWGVNSALGIGVIDMGGGNGDILRFGLTSNGATGAIVQVERTETIRVVGPAADQKLILGATETNADIDLGGGTGDHVALVNGLTNTVLTLSGVEYLDVDTRTSSGYLDHDVTISNAQGGLSFQNFGGNADVVRFLSGAGTTNRVTNIGGVERVVADGGTLDLDLPGGGTFDIETGAATTVKLHTNFSGTWVGLDEGQGDKIDLSALGGGTWRLWSADGTDRDVRLQHDTGGGWSDVVGLKNATSTDHTLNGGDGHAVSQAQMDALLAAWQGAGTVV